MVNCATEESSSGAFFIVFSDHTRHAISLAYCNFTRLWLMKISTHACEIYRHITLWGKRIVVVCAQNLLGVEAVPFLGGGGVKLPPPPPLDN